MRAAPGSGGAALEGEPMDENTDTTVEELGPVDYLVIEFPAGEQNFTGEAARSWPGWSSRGSSASSTC